MRSQQEEMLSVVRTITSRERNFGGQGFFYSGAMFLLIDNQDLKTSEIHFDTNKT
jgi:hypothetical protein